MTYTTHGWPVPGTALSVPPPLKSPCGGPGVCEGCSYDSDQAHKVGKYEGLWVLQNAEGLRWAMHLQQWVTEESNDFTSWSDTNLEFQGFGIDDLDLLQQKLDLPDGEWININES